MDNEEHKRRDDDQEQAKRPPIAQVEQNNSDQVLAALIQQQESAFTMLETIMSDTEEEEEDEDEEDEEEDGESTQEDENDDTEDGEYQYYLSNFFRGLEYEAELDFLDEEDSNADQMEEDDIDPDELTYEDLVALGEIVGEENRGLTEEEISSSLCPYVCRSLESKTSMDRCVICQVEYEEGEQVVALHCKHPFHADCINRWLQIKKNCPICGTEATSFTQKEGK